MFCQGALCKLFTIGRISILGASDISDGVVVCWGCALSRISHSRINDGHSAGLSFPGHITESNRLYTRLSHRAGIEPATTLVYHKTSLKSLVFKNRKTRHKLGLSRIMRADNSLRMLVIAYSDNLSYPKFAHSP